MVIGPDDLLLVCLRGEWLPREEGGWGSSDTECLGNLEPTEAWPTLNLAPFLAVGSLVVPLELVGSAAPLVVVN